MPTREEIREGLVELCRERTSGAGRVLAGEILAYLHSQGAAIKVDGPMVNATANTRFSFEGYSAFEPLI